MNDNLYHTETDMYWELTNQGFNGRFLKQAHNWCLSVTELNLSVGFDVVVSNTFTQLWEMEPYLSLTDDVTVYCMTKQYQSIHGVPESTVEKMRNRFEPYDGEILV